ncbi:hypothetical protein Nepgr_008260 [Nepenthes gracilis]|uniref:Uncharacterized protein n=1 Tax=Nepenthes gracilis TaxID=150966 RepID=A0AAD3XJ78_NEPGR|nr:hypothetical protein Nepgr_008260 [Nepenthes gracilis]
MKTTELNSIENISKTFGKKGISINSCHNEAAQKIDPQQTTSSKVRRMATQQKNFQHRVPTQSSGFNDVDGFQPMAPGSSPDVGQLFEGEKTDTMAIAESPDVKWKDDFQPITPGDGPAVGHPFVGHTDNISQTSQTEDNYRPTLPGRSPGVGHLSRKEYKEPNV